MTDNNKAWKIVTEHLSNDHDFINHLHLAFIDLIDINYTFVPVSVLPGEQHPLTIDIGDMATVTVKPTSELPLTFLAYFAADRYKKDHRTYNNAVTFWRYEFAFLSMKIGFYNALRFAAIVAYVNGKKPATLLRLLWKEGILQEAEGFDQAAYKYLLELADTGSKFRHVVEGERCAFIGLEVDEEEVRNHLKKLNEQEAVAEKLKKGTGELDLGIFDISIGPDGPEIITAESTLKIITCIDRLSNRLEELKEAISRKKKNNIPELSRAIHKLMAEKLGFTEGKKKILYNKLHGFCDYERVADLSLFSAFLGEGPLTLEGENYDIEVKPANTRIRPFYVGALVAQKEGITNESQVHTYYEEKISPEQERMGIMNTVALIIGIFAAMERSPEAFLEKRRFDLLKGGHFPDMVKLDEMAKMAKAYFDLERLEYNDTITYYNGIPENAVKKAIKSGEVDANIQDWLLENKPNHDVIFIHSAIK